MRHKELTNRGNFDIVEVAAFETTASGIESAERQVSHRPEAAVPDVPSAVGVMMVVVYVAIVALFAMTIANAGHALFMIAIDIAFLAAFFAVPVIMLKHESDPARRPTMARFMAQGMQTYTGHVTGGGALVQMFVVPVLLAFAVLAIGIIASLA